MKHSKVSNSKNKLINKSIWANDYYIKLIERKKELIKKYHNKPHNFLISSNLKEIQNEIFKLKRELKNKYYVETFNKYKSNPKKMWSTLNAIIYNKETVKKSSLIQELEFKNKSYTNSKEIANCLNDYFINIGTELNKDNLSDLNDLKALGTLDKIVNHTNVLYNFEPTDYNEVKHILRTKIKKDKSPGIDGITPKCLKKLDNTIINTIVKIINVILNEGIFPEWAKEALV